jgi:hypothetical protein
VIAFGPQRAPDAERLGPHLDKFSAALEKQQVEQTAVAKERNDLLRGHYSRQGSHWQNEEVTAAGQRDLWAAQAGEARTRTGSLQNRVIPGHYQVIRATEKEVFLLDTLQGQVVKRELK